MCKHASNLLGFYRNHSHLRKFYWNKFCMFSVKTLPKPCKFNRKLICEICDISSVWLRISWWVWWQGPTLLNVKNSGFQNWNISKAVEGNKVNQIHYVSLYFIPELQNIFGQNMLSEPKVSLCSKVLLQKGSMLVAFWWYLKYVVPNIMWDLIILNLITFFLSSSEQIIFLPSLSRNSLDKKQN